MPDSLFPLRKDRGGSYGTVQAPHVAEEIRLADEAAPSRDSIQQLGDRVNEAAKPAIAVAGVGINMAADAVVGAARAGYAYGADHVARRRAGEKFLWYKDPALGCAAGLLLTLLLLSSGASPAPKKAPAAQLPIMQRTARAPAGLRIDFQQLPCWSGSCDNWQLQSDYAMPDAACDSLAREFGCHPCKRMLDAGLAPYRPNGRIAVCPTPPEEAKVVKLAGTTVTARRARVATAEHLYLEHLPCATGSCSNYLLQLDASAITGRDAVCNYFSRSFGCGDCKSRASLATDARLEEYIRGGRRVTKCARPPPSGSLQTASGITLEVREYQPAAAAPATDHDPFRALTQEPGAPTGLTYEEDAFLEDAETDKDTDTDTEDTYEDPFLKYEIP